MNIKLQSVLIAYKNDIDTLQSKVNTLIVIDEITEQEAVAGLEKFNFDISFLEDIDKLKAIKKNQVMNYRWERQRYFEYDFCMQRWEADDKVAITDSIQALKEGYYTSINWRYSDGNYRTITDATYLEQMKLAGYKWEQTLRSVNKTIEDKIDSIETLEELKVDWIKQFNSILASL